MIAYLVTSLHCLFPAWFHFQPKHVPRIRSSHARAAGRETSLLTVCGGKPPSASRAVLTPPTTPETDCFVSCVTAEIKLKQNSDGVRRYKILFQFYFSFVLHVGLAL
jgi:hypothetical protein